MKSSKENTIDPFKNITLDNFKNETTSSLKSKNKLDKDTIKTIANESNFQSREFRQLSHKQKIVTKTFSLFPTECSIINNAIKAYFSYSSENEPSQPSSSDVVRAALHAFGQRTLPEQINMIKHYRGRGRK